MTHCLPESLLNEQMRDILIFEELDLPPAEVSSLSMASSMEMKCRGAGDLAWNTEAAPNWTIRCVYT